MLHSRQSSSLGKLILAAAGCAVILACAGCWLRDQRAAQQAPSAAPSKAQPDLAAEQLAAKLQDDLNILTTAGAEGFVAAYQHCDFQKTAIDLRAAPDQAKDGARSILRYNSTLDKQAQATCHVTAYVPISLEVIMTGQWYAQANAVPLDTVGRALHELYRSSGGAQLDTGSSGTQYRSDWYRFVFGPRTVSFCEQVSVSGPQPAVISDLIID